MRTRGLPQTTQVMSNDEWGMAVFTLDLPRNFSGVQRQCSVGDSKEGTSVRLRDRRRCYEHGRGRR
jgi:hypothetical protein